MDSICSKILIKLSQFYHLSSFPGFRSELARFNLCTVTVILIKTPLHVIPGKLKAVAGKMDYRDIGYVSKGALVSMILRICMHKIRL